MMSYVVRRGGISLNTVKESKDCLLFSDEKFSISLMIFCLLLSITEKGVSNSPTVIMDLSISALSSLTFASCILKLCY